MDFSGDDKILSAIGVQIPTNSSFGSFGGARQGQTTSRVPVSASTGSVLGF